MKTNLMHLFHVGLLLLSLGAPNANADSKVNFLWVLDNSASMRELRGVVQGAFPHFLETLNSKQAIDYKMAVTTTDFFSQQGSLVEASCGTNVVKSSVANPAAVFTSMVDSIQDFPTSFWEQGLESSYIAIKTHGGAFTETGVPLVIIYLTNEEDYSCKDECYGVEPEHNQNWKAHPVDRYLNYFRYLGTENGIEVSAFPLIGTEDSPCDIASVGKRYEAVQMKLGLGVTASICKSLLSDNLNNIARVVSEKYAGRR